MGCGGPCGRLPVASSKAGGPLKRHVNGCQTEAGWEKRSKDPRWGGRGGGGGHSGSGKPQPTPLCDIPSGRCSFTAPWTVTRSSLRMLRRVAAFCRPLRPVLLLVSFPRSRSPVVGVLGLC